MPKAIPNTDSVYYREPRLLLPRRKPVGPVKIEWGHDLAEGLESFTLLDGAAGTGIDLVANRPLSFNDQHTASILDGNQVLEITRAGQADAAFFQPLGRFYKSITTKLTVVVRTRYNSTANFGPMAAVPYAATGWSMPFMSFAFGRDKTLASARVFVAQGTLNKQGISGLGYLDLTQRTYAATLDTTAAVKINFYRDGEFFSGTNGNVLTDAINWNTKNPLVFGNASHNGASLESGEMEEEYAMIYSRVLSAREISAIHRDPYQLVTSA